MTENWNVQSQPGERVPVPGKIDKHEKRRRRLRKLKSCCQTFWAFLFSHIGLSAVVVAYTIMGGFLFKWLEAPHEKSVNTNMKARKNGTALEILDQINEYENDTETLFAKILLLLEKYEGEIIKEVKDNGYDGKKIDDIKWTYAGALLFAVTVITTIGYGHVAPKTIEGRIVTILYALVGIPLTFLCLANIGDFLANCFRWFYAKICCGLCCILFRTSNSKKKRTDQSKRLRPRKDDTKNKGKFKRKGKKFRLENRNASHDSLLPTDISMTEYEDIQVETSLDDNEMFYSTLDIFADYKESTLSLADTKIHLKDEDVVISIQDLYQAKETDLTNSTDCILSGVVENANTTTNTTNNTTNTTTEQDITSPDSNAPQSGSVAASADITPIPEQPAQTPHTEHKKRKFSTRRKRNRRKDKRWKSDTDAMFRDLNEISPTSSGLESQQRTGLGGSAGPVMERYTGGSEMLNLDMAHQDIKASRGEKKVRVPITVCLLLIFVYVLVGGFLFARWEGWDFLTGSYFCFVTLSTIGFGDLVPGTQLDAWESQEKLVACAMYLFMGLSVIAMCFNLMQEEVKEKFRWLARKIGIMSNEKD